MTMTKTSLKRKKYNRKRIEWGRDREHDIEKKKCTSNRNR